MLKPSYGITLIGSTWLGTPTLKKWLSVGNGRNFYGCLKFYISHKVLINLKSHETNHKVAITHLNI